MPQFELGGVTATKAALQFCKENDINIVLQVIWRHQYCDWGDLGREDKAANLQAIRDGLRIVSAYKFPAGRLTCITEADRSLTTVYVDGEY
jgi:hypothetical protein